jgi:oxygen-independent coproporphyrinogen-3 oxidase
MTAPALGVYVHWPYCARICPYCDFNVYRSRAVDADVWTSALRRDLGHWAERTKGRKLASLYFGGGTPSLAPARTLAAIVDECALLWGFEDGAEITLEANPTDAERRRFAAIRSAGVNRLSLGVQSFDDAALKFLGRDHDGRAARAAIGLGLETFARLTFDLIYALPGQSADGWRRALRDALATGAAHLSLYQLTIEEGTAFSRAVARGAFSPPDDDAAATLFDAAQEETEAAGLPAYEVSNHARPGEESRHNLLYWEGGDYVGVGPGAHGRLTIAGARIATETHLRPDDYLAAVARTGAGARRQAPLDREARLVEKLAAGLRLARGVAFGEDERDALGPRAERLKILEADGLLRIEPGRLVAAPAGRRVLDRILSELLA